MYKHEEEPTEKTTTTSVGKMKNYLMTVVRFTSSDPEGQQKTVLDVRAISASNAQIEKYQENPEFTADFVSGKMGVTQATAPAEAITAYKRTEKFKNLQKLTA